MNKIIEITDFLAPELDVYARLTEVQLLNREYPEKGLFLSFVSSLFPKCFPKKLSVTC